MVRATFEGLTRMSSPRQIAAKRGKKPSEIVSRRNKDEVIEDGEGSEKQD